MPKMKCPYKYTARSRAAKVDYICGIGGYGSRDGRFPIEFNVAADRCDLDFDNMAKLVRQYHNNPTDPDESRVWDAAVRNAYEECKEHLWDWGIEDAQRGLFDADTYKMLWDGTMLKVGFELHGRQGKHLVLTEFEGMTLKGKDEDDLRSELMLQTGPRDDKDDEAKLRAGYTWEYSNDFVDRFYRYVVQCASDFTPAKASAEVEYQAAFFVYSRAEDEAKRLTDLLADRDNVAEAAKLLRDNLELDEPELKEALTTLCLSAGLAPSAILQR